MPSDRALPVELTSIAATGVDLDRALRALASPRRRYLLARACDSAAPLSLEEVVHDVVRWELDCDDDEVSPEMEQSVLTSLYHVHAPMLADAGLVEFDADENTVAVSTVGAQLKGMPFLPVVEETQ